MDAIQMLLKCLQKYAIAFLWFLSDNNKKGVDCVKIKFTVTGMTCAACSARVEKVTVKVPGVEKAEVNLLGGSMMVTARDASVTEPIITAIVNAGYGASLAGEKEKKQEVPADNALKEMKKRIVFSFGFLVVLMYFTMGHMVGLPEPHWYHGAENAVVAALLQLMLTLPVVYLNRAYYTRGLKALWHRSPNMDSLIAVGSLASLLYGVALSREPCKMLDKLTFRQGLECDII